MLQFFNERYSAHLHGYAHKISAPVCTKSGAIFFLVVRTAVKTRMTAVKVCATVKTKEANLYFNLDFNSVCCDGKDGTVQAVWSNFPRLVRHTIMSILKQAQCSKLSCLKRECPGLCEINKWAGSFKIITGTSNFKIGTLCR